MTTIVLACAVVGVIAAIGFFVVRWTLNLELDFSGTGGLGDWTEYGYEPAQFAQTGTLPMSRTFSESVYRWHDPNHLHEGSDFWRTFEDGPWKWKSQERYAGEYLNCGHFFALTPAGANAEADFYEIARGSRTLLKARVTSQRILDLTYESNLIEAARSLVGWDGSRNELLDALDALLDSAKGGTWLTDSLGRWAAAHGYDGILFFGARAFLQDETLVWQIRHGGADRLGFNMVAYSFNTLRKNPDYMNLVFLSGAGLTTAIETYAMPADAGDVRNEYFGMRDLDLDLRLKFGVEYQREQRARADESIIVTD